MKSKGKEGKVSDILQTKILTSLKSLKYNKRYDIGFREKQKKKTKHKIKNKKMKDVHVLCGN